MRPRSYSNGSINTVSIIELDNVLIVCYSAFKAIHQRSLPIFFMWIASRFTTGLMHGKRDASLAYTIGKGKGSVSKVEMATPMALIYKVLFPSISTFETPPFFPITGCEFSRVQTLLTFALE